MKYSCVPFLAQLFQRNLGFVIALVCLHLCNSLFLPPPPSLKKSIYIYIKKNKFKKKKSFT